MTLRAVQSDQQERERIRSSLGESLMVEAGAGTGKTTELINRMVSVVRSGATGIERVVCVTFTRKAAGELKLRLRQELDKVREIASPEERPLLEASISRLEEARIGTIHSFCAELLRERPVESRVDPAFAELSEKESPLYFERAFRSWIEKRLDSPLPGLDRALSRIRGGGTSRVAPLSRIQMAAWNLAEWRDYGTPWTRPDYNREPTIDTLVNDVHEIADLSSRSAKQWDALRKSLRPVRQLSIWAHRWERERNRDYNKLEGLLAKLLTDLRRDKRKGRGPYGPGVSRQKLAERRDLLVAALEDFKKVADADLAALLQEELREVVADYEEMKGRAGRLDFVDLLIKARDLIRDNAEVRSYFQTRFTHIFVDEFQDTDPLQAELLLLLAANDPMETSWRRAHPKPGKLFLVGDPKQSIYRFRRADVALYQNLRSHLQASGVGLVQLSQSFRSVRPLQLAMNAAFGEAMREDQDAGQTDYAPLEGFRTPSGNQPSLIVLPVPKPYGRYGITDYAIDQSQPDTVAAFIAWLVTNSHGWTVENPLKSGERVPIAPQHICILFRRFLSWGRDVTRDYTRGLETRGVPHVLIGARSFHQREEVETLRSALSAIEWPEDELSIFATLRGSFFGISDARLLEYRFQVGPLHSFLPPPADKTLEPFAHIVDALSILRDLHRRRNRRPIVATLNELLERTRAHAGFALRPAGHQVLANVQRVCDLARGFEVSGGLSFRGFVEYLDRESDSSSSGEAPVAEEGAEGVRIMTVHSAKGLEFPIVVLADSTAKLHSKKPDKFVDLESGLAAIKLLGCAPLELVDQEEQEAGRDRAEGVRITYVAATRARDLLIVPGIGDQAHPGWLSPLNPIIYPEDSDWRTSRETPGCPTFGTTTVLERPAESDGRPDRSVVPGLHIPSLGEHEVVWWDPTLNPQTGQPNFGLRQAEILSKTDTPESLQGFQAFQEWKDRRKGYQEKGQRPSHQPFTVSQADRSPPLEDFRIRIESVDQRPDRPSGKRFGTLVHTALRDVVFEATKSQIEQICQLQARVLGADQSEVVAAIEVLEKTLQHPIIRAASKGKPCYREIPILSRFSDSGLLEGTIDLAFFKDGTWTVVDFKTDLNLEAVRSRYEKQLGWYLAGLQQLTGESAEGVLLNI